ncbi:DUF7519 family protein [Haloarcula marina]|uniref:DUF7519 family protein n=1 Tax=Haloarcula marina TaxID=2961574 RepID=UPI0020B8B961|nr:hypothetical protein [Halomicroarcula marina]
MSLTRPVGTAAVVAAAVGVLSVATTLGGPLAVLGGVVITVGVARDDRRFVTAGGALLAFGVLVAGVLGTATVALVVGLAAAILAWDFGQYACALAVGTAPDAVTQNAELVRVAGGTLVAACVVGLLSLSVAVVAVPAVDTVTATLLFAGIVLTVYGVR